MVDPFFQYNIEKDEIIGLYNGTTSEEFNDYYNIDNIEIVFTKNNKDYSGTILEDSKVTIKVDDSVYTTNIRQLETPEISTYAYNGTNFSMPLNKTNLLSNISCGWGCYSGHKGTDFAWSGISGSSIYSVEKGTVYSSYNGCSELHNVNSSCGSGWGNYVSVSHSGGARTLYAHMQLNSKTVSNGNSVSKGSVIGKVGSTGASTGFHLHFEVYISGTRVNAYPYLDGAPLPNSSSTSNPGTGSGINLISEKGTFTPQYTLNVRTSPSTSSPSVAQYVKGESFNYDSYGSANGYGWLSYISSSGVRRYVAYRVTGSEYYGTFSNIQTSYKHVSETGTF